MQSNTGARPTIVIVSAVHDYRMARRGSIQAIADAFVRAGFRAVFLSVRFSALSLLKRDPRAFLSARANRLEHVEGVDCYLWRTPLHPFETGTAIGNWLMAPLHGAFAGWPNTDVDRLLGQADVVMVESGLGIVLIPRIRRLNPGALLIYRGSDDLATIGAHPDLQRRLEQSGPHVDQYCLLARAMAPAFRFARERTFAAPQAVQPSDYADIGPSPYASGRRNAVCVGSMLFDPSFFASAAPAFPDVDFHVIGCGGDLARGANVFVHGEMPFRDALPYIKHADIGIAPYRAAPAAHYLAESSLKLTQFAYLRLPAVCPHFAVGTAAHRFGYAPGNGDSIALAMEAALADSYAASEPAPLSWDDLVPRFLRPRDFADTMIAPGWFDGSIQNTAATPAFAAYPARRAASGVQV